MIRKKSPFSARETVIDLTGPDGNAFVLMGYVNSYARQLNLNPKTILDEMRESDYDNLVAVFDRYFGDYITLLR